MVDSNDRERVQEAREELNKMVNAVYILYNILPRVPTHGVYACVCISPVIFIERRSSWLFIV